MSIEPQTDASNPADTAPPDAADASPIAARLMAARRDLLDVSNRNRLLNTPRRRNRSRSVEIVAERSAQVFSMLVAEDKAMGFLPAEEPPADAPPDAGGQPPSLLPQPEADEFDEAGVARQTDTSDAMLQTTLTSEALQKRLLSTYYDARTAEEEQGVGILYLALGFLKWLESETSDREFFAPLLLIPVALERQAANTRFRLRYTGEEVATNLSLAAKLKSDFNVDLPEVPDIEELSPADYFAAVSRAVAGRPRWQVLADDIVLGFFSFSKFLMYRDLDPRTWPTGSGGPQSRPLIGGLLGEGFDDAPPLCGPDDPIDPLIAPGDMVHVLDADSSQAIAIEEVRRGRNLVIQGPPGTGKSQTIANLIAAAVRDGRKVLFLAEKMAALSVVKRRLDHIGLGDMCLELHSNKANKRLVLQELGRTLELGRPSGDADDGGAADLARVRDRLNAHAGLMLAPLPPSGLTPYRLLGELVSLRRRGVPAADFELPDAPQWPPDERHRRVGRIRDAAEHLRETGTPSAHPWRGVLLDAILPTDQDRLAAAMTSPIARLDRLAGVADALGQLLTPLPAGTAADLARLADAARRLADAPPMDRAAIANASWADQRARIADLVSHGRLLAESRGQLTGVVSPAAWSMDLAQTRADLAAYSHSWIRWLNRNWRRAKATLRGMLAGPLPASADERLGILDSLIAAQAAKAAVERADALGAAAFGRLWAGPESDWAALAAVEQWDAANAEICDPAVLRRVVADPPDAAALTVPADQVAADLPPLLSEAGELAERLKLDLPRAFGVKELPAVALADLRSRLADWRRDPESLSRWIAARLRLDGLASEGLGELADRLYDGRIAPDGAEDQFHAACCETMMRRVLAEHPELAAFDGKSHSRVREEFQSLDRSWIERMARREVAAAHYRGLPHNGGSLGEMGVLRHELAKQRRHLPIRQLLRRAGRAVQAIKPVLMMSPMSVAQFLEPGGVEFDLLLIDEASQVRPVDAFGAAARAGQIVVVGDDKQLPPTRFFNVMLESDDDADEGELHTADLESILGLCASQSMAQRMLRWHYRSRHHSLIAVSNREFYENRLYVIPSPTDGGDRMGLKFHHQADGVFDRGRSATNRVEARAVARAVMDHARRCGDLTLGVGAFSIGQRDAILDELERLRREGPDPHEFFSPSRPEPFFVKNLETIQGDERDVIFISIGYGRDDAGAMSMNFGPLSADGGERRLNVLITRARQRCEVFSSITDDDIDLSRATGRGPLVLKTFLAYARTGRLDATAGPSGRDADSPFELEVAEALRAQGHEVHYQVGVAGFFIDLAVVDPRQPGRYLLGIECDGASYHSARSARDRDRLRQEVLEDRGWILHRIWSTDWFHRPVEQLAKALAAIERARAELAARDADDRLDETAEPSDAPVDPATIARDPADDDAPSGIAAAPYRVARLSVPRELPIHKLSAARLAGIVARIVAVEGPVHEEEVARRTAALWGQHRSGSRVADAIRAALALGVEQGKLRADGPFYSPADRQQAPIRNRAGVEPATLRRVEMLPPAEIAAAVETLVSANMGIGETEVATHVARLLGFGAAGANLRGAIAREVARLADAGTLESRDGCLYRAQS
ncbi:MAG: hypothetical protein BIFFINMI_01591 [Phycisphaerae bacterium]|nr:hypothetical protein [Phycisphaerae bacterium]